MNCSVKYIVRNDVTSACSSTVYAVSIVCMLAALPLSHTIATAYNATEAGVRFQRLHR